MTIAVTLPAPVRAAPEDELAVAIEDIPVVPHGIGGVNSGTTSMDVITGPVPSLAQESPVARATNEPDSAGAGASAGTTSWCRPRRHTADATGCAAKSPPRRNRPPC